MYHSLSPVLTTDASISINTSIRSSCASEDSCDIIINISVLLNMLMFSEDMVKCYFGLLHLKVMEPITIGNCTIKLIMIMINVRQGIDTVMLCTPSDTR